MKLKPLHDRVLVKRVESDKKTKGGLFIPDAHQDKPQEAEIVAVGPGRRDDSGKLIEPCVKKGDRVLLGKYSGSEVKVEGEEYVIVREDEILCVIE